MQGFPKCVRPFSMIFIRIIAFKSVEKPKTRPFNEPEPKLWLRSGLNKAKVFVLTE